MPGYQTGSELLGGQAQQTMDEMGPDSNPNDVRGGITNTQNGVSLEDEDAQLRPLEERT